MALKYFNFEQIYNWWEYTINFEDLEEDELEAWSKILPDNYYMVYSEVEALKIIEKLSNRFEFLPKIVDIATARAVFDYEYQWVKILDIIDKYDLEMYIDTYEAEAIKLGIKMKQELGEPDYLIVNDNKHAVTDITGHPVYTWGWKYDSMEQSSYILWAPRKMVKLADRLTVEDATRIFGPDDYLDDFEDD